MLPDILFPEFFFRMRRRLSKIFFHLQLNRFSAHKPLAGPQHLQIEPTVRCNLECTTCSRESVIASYSRLDLEVQQIKKVRKELPLLKSVKLQGLGEPFLHPQIDQILLELKGLRIWMITNGTLFGLEKYRLLATTHLSDVSISIDSLDHEKFQMLRKPAKLEKVLEGLDALIKDRDSSNRSLSIGVNFVASHLNIDEIPALEQFVLDRKLDYLSVVPVENWNIPGEKQYEEARIFVQKSRAQRIPMMKAVRRLQRRLALHAVPCGFKGDSKRLGSCHWPFTSAFISVEGYVTPCCLRMHKQHAMGRIEENSSFLQIWKGESYSALRASHVGAGKSCALCSNCPN